MMVCVVASVGVTTMIALCPCFCNQHHYLHQICQNNILRMFAIDATLLYLGVLLLAVFLTHVVNLNDQSFLSSNFCFPLRRYVVD